MRFLLTLFLLGVLAGTLSAQSDKTLALKKGREAIEMMDNGKVDESIELLKECQKLDPKNYVYPYEIAYAHILKKDYQGAVKVLKKVKKYKNANSQVYQMSGNCYSYMGEPEKAIKEYEKGMERFPNAGNLHLEKGNIFLMREEYAEAVENYKRGIKADPMYPSNYYRLALLYMGSKDKLSGVIYGEIFMNIERTTPRTQEISKLLYDTYNEAITIKKNEAKIDFCEIFINISDFDEEKGELTLPLCAAFGKNFILATVGQEEFSLGSLSAMRISFLENFFKEDHKDYPNVLFEYQKEMLDKGLFEAYNHYLFQVGAPDAFEEWLEENQGAYDEFADWYVKDANIINVTRKNCFINK